MCLKNRFMRSCMTIIMSLIVILINTTLSGCAKGEEEQIRSIITESMTMLKNPTEEALSPYIEESEIDLSSLDAYGIDFYEFLTYCFRNLDYSIDEILIDGKKATAKLTMTNVDLTAAAQAASDEITSNIGSYTDILSSKNAERGLMDIFINRFYGQLNRSSERITTEAVLEFSKKDGVWEVDAESVISMMEDMIASVEL